MKMIGIFCRLTKIFSGVCIAGSALAGFCLASGKFPIQSLVLFVGLLFLSMGAGVLNQMQEIDLDRKMERTRYRPLPAGEIHPWVAGFIALLLLLSGLGLLFYFQEMVVGILGIIGLFLYNGLYTPLKARVSWAIFPGALAGCIPPVMGFFAGGGSATDRTCLLLVGVAYFWQIAHFCFFILVYKDEYQASDDKNLYRELGISGVNILAILCMGACIIMAFENLFFPVYGSSGYSKLVFMAGICLLLSMFIVLAKIFQSTNFFRGAFLIWNVLLGGGIIYIVQGCL